VASLGSPSPLKFQTFFRLDDTPPQTPENDHSYILHSIPIRRRAFINIKQGRLNETYKILGEIGNGSKGVVKKVEHRATKAIFACKIVQKSELKAERADEFFEEFETLR
jgi:hypothetical protein